MNNNSNKAISLIFFVFGIIFLLAGSTFAYFSASISSGENSVTGTTLTFNVNMNITTIKNDELIPLADSLIDDTLNSTHICTDTRGYGLCYLYQIALTNSGDAVTMNGYLKTLSTTYTTNNLKYQLFTYNSGTSTYTAVTDIKTVPLTANATSDFTLSNAKIDVSLASGKTTSYSTNYYLAIWLSDPGNNQLVDSNKTYSGSVTFISVAGGGSVTVEFN